MSANGGGGTAGGTVRTHTSGRVFSTGLVGGVGGGGGAPASPEAFIVGAQDAILQRQAEVLAELRTALVDLFDGNAEVARTISYDTGLIPERCAEIAEVVEACRRWRAGGGA